MSREEDKELLSNLIFANKKFAENLEELKKLDGMAARAAALNEVDTEKILENLNRVSLTRISHEIIKKLKEELEQSREQIITSAAGAEAAAKELSKQSENLRVASDSFMNLDNMADDLNNLVKNVQKWKTKTIYGAVGLSLFFGLFSGVFVSNISSIFAEQAIRNAEILTPKFGAISTLQNKTDPNIYYFAFDGKKIKPQIETFEKDGVRYILFEGQKK